MCPNGEDGMAHSVDPAPLIRVYIVCPDLSIRKLSIITVKHEGPN